MKLILAEFAFVSALFGASMGYSQTNLPRPDYAVAPVPFKDVQITDSFWMPRLENNRARTIPLLFDHYGQSGRGADLRLLEAACYLLIQNPDPALKSRVDSQLDTAIARIRARKHRWSMAGDGDGLWAGNFLETAVAYYEATGSRMLLDVAVEIGNDLDEVFGPGKRHDISNHEGIEIGLLRLYRCTGDDKYLKLARFFLDARGNPEGRPGLYGPYAQDHMPVKSQTRAIGHAVRATYLYMPLTDLAALTGDAGYWRADERIWQDAVSKRTYLSGGVGTYRDEEDYGDDYDLPNLSCWNETCAAYGNVLWNDKLFLMESDARYADMLERTLYNALLAGVSLGGDRFLYQTPLKAYGDFARHDWFGPNCCPPNVARLLPQLGSLIYVHTGHGLYVNLFIASQAKLAVDGEPISLKQETRYPWDGAVRLTLSAPAPRRISVFVRIPGWARNQPMPGDLYRYLAAPEEKFTLSVNGRPTAYSMAKGYARINREWKAGDTIELNLPMPVRRVVAAKQVADDRGFVALERGPLVFCAEQTDNAGGVFNLVLPDRAGLQFAYRDQLLGGIGTITGKAITLGRGADGVSVTRQPQDFVAVPYYAFANRGQGEMAVWLAREESRAVIAPAPTIASTSRATSSCGNGTVAENYPGHNPPTIARRFYPGAQDGSGDIRAICDQLQPVNSEDGSAPYLRLHPEAGDAAWVQYDFAKPATVSSVEVYWKDDKQYCVLPHSWRLLYQEGGEWKPVTGASAYTVARDKFNKVTFHPVTTSGLRLEIQLQGKLYKPGSLGPPDANYMSQDLTWYEGGVIEWRVNP